MAHISEKQPQADPTLFPSSTRNPIRGVWELARLHTREAWLCWYPCIWGACAAAGTYDASIGLGALGQMLFGIWASVTAAHCTFCTWNGILDQGFDKDVERCKVRPLLAGLISTTEAVLAFLCWVPGTLALTHATLGGTVLLSFMPVWALSLIYPLMKRLFPFPQVVLGVIIGGAVFPGWVCVTHTLDNLDSALPLFFATAAWVIYFDIFYATQDRPDDVKIGVESLAVLMGRHVRILLSALGALQIGLFILASLRANLSPVFWLLGLGPWIVNVPLHVLSLDLEDRHSGGAIFMANIKLGLYLSVVSLVEIVIHHIPLGRLGDYVFGFHVRLTATR